MSAPYFLSLGDTVGTKVTTEFWTIPKGPMAKACRWCDAIVDHLCGAGGANLFGIAAYRRSLAAIAL